ncbi:MAG: hypothetical protein BRD57_00270, partial [Proteobacteria bacterium SW_6_67_9]
AEQEPDAEAMLMDTEATEALGETPPPGETDETVDTTSATGDETGATAAAESALMEESLDLSAIEGGEETTPVLEDEDEETKDDTVAEADVYLAYGLHQQAEDVLRLALKESPQRADYQEKLLETVYGAGKREQFLTEAKAYQGMVDPASSRGWQRVVAMGRDIAPDDALFSSVEDPGVTPDALQPAKPDSASSGGEDLEFDLSGLDSGDAEATASADEAETPSGEPEAAAAGDELEFDLSDLDLEEPKASEPAEVAEADEPTTSHETADFDLSDIDLGEPETSEAQGGGETGEPAASSGGGDLDWALETSAEQPSSAGDAPSSDEAEADFELDLGDLDTGEEAGAATDGGDQTSAEDALDLDSLATLGEGDAGEAQAEATDLDSQFAGAATDSSATTSDAGAGEASASSAGGSGGTSDIDSGEEEYDTMLDLAKAYIDMGDADSASNALQEVIESGSENQRREAEKLLETVQ